MYGWYGFIVYNDNGTTITHHKYCSDKCIPQIQAEYVKEYGGKLVKVCRGVDD